MADMMHDHRLPYRWQDHVITPRRAAMNLVASALMVATIGAAILHARHDHKNPAQLAAVPFRTEYTPSLAHLAKRPALSHRMSHRL
jgi:hypothetical protein